MYPIVIQCLVDTIYKPMSSHNKTIVQNCHNIIFNSIITLGNLGEAALKKCGLLFTGIAKTLTCTRTIKLN